MEREDKEVVNMTNGEKSHKTFSNLEYEIFNKSRVVLTNIDNGTWLSLDWWNAEYKEPTTKNDLVVDKEQLKTMIRGLTKWYVKRDNTEVGEPNTAVGLLYDDVMFGIDRLPSVTQEPRKGHWEHGKELCKEYHGKILVDITYEDWHCSNCHCVVEQSIKPKWSYCPNCGADMRGEGA